MIFQIFFVKIPWTGTESSVNHRHRFSKSLRRFSHPFFQKIYPQSLAKCASRRCRQQREKYAALRQGQSVSCQSKILPRCHNSLSAHSVPSESCWGVPSPNPAVTAYTAVVPLASAAKIYFSRWLRFLKKMSIERWEDNASALPPLCLPQQKYIRGDTWQRAEKCPMSIERGEGK